MLPRRPTRLQQSRPAGLLSLGAPSRSQVRPPGPARPGTCHTAADVLGPPPAGPMLWAECHEVVAVLVPETHVFGHVR